MTPTRAVVVMAALVFAMPTLVGQSEPVDLQAVYAIKDEGLQRSKVMEITSYLTDVHGPRLTGSPEIRRAGEWAVKEMQSWGLANARLEPWTGFGRGWTNERFAAHMTAPATATLIGYPKAWTPGTNGVVTGDAVQARLDTPADLETWRGKLKGKFVLMAQARDADAALHAAGRALHRRRAVGSVTPAHLGGPRPRRRAGRPARDGGLRSRSDGLPGVGGHPRDDRARTRRRRHGLRPERRIQERGGPADGAAGGAGRRALQPDPAHPREEDPGDARDGRSEHVSRRRRRRLQRRRRDSRAPTRPTSS